MRRLKQILLNEDEPVSFVAYFRVHVLLLTSENRRGSKVPTAQAKTSLTEPNNSGNIAPAAFKLSRSPEGPTCKDNVRALARSCSSQLEAVGMPAPKECRQLQAADLTPVVASNQDQPEIQKSRPEDSAPTTLQDAHPSTEVPKSSAEQQRIYHPQVPQNRAVVNTITPPVEPLSKDSIATPIKQLEGNQRPASHTQLPATSTPVQQEVMLKSCKEPTRTSHWKRKLNFGRVLHMA